MADHSYMTDSKQLYSDDTLPMESVEKRPTLGSFISSEIAPTIGDVTRRSKKGGIKWQSEMGRLLSKENVAKRLDIKEDMLQKKLYHRDTSRDWIIAICAAYGLDSGAIDEALVLYNWPTLDPNVNRDLLIKKYLDLHCDCPTSLADINYILENRGFLPLQIHKRNSNSMVRNRNAKKSRFIQGSGIRIRTFGFEGNRYDSLETEFFPTHRVEAEMLVEGPGGELFKLSAASDGKLECHTSEKSVDGKSDHKDVGDVWGTYDSIDHPDFGCFFLELLNKAKSEMQKYDDRLYDSRNYQGRFSANLKDCALHVFYEEYNYKFPERNEYYLMEYWNGQYTLSVSHESMFMREYLSEDEYFEHYRSRGTVKAKTYSSIHEIEALMANVKDWQTEIVFKNRKNTFERLQELVAAKVADIQNKKIFIRKFDAIWDNPADVLRYYKIEDIFNCEYDPDYREICNCLDLVTIDAGTENEVVITFDDVRTGFECGFSSFEDICKYKRCHESIAEVLK